MSRAREVLVAGDCFINACLGGYAGETMSARIWRERTTQPCKFLLPVVDWVALHIFFDPDHCYGSYLKVLQRAHVPAEYLQATMPAAN